MFGAVKSGAAYAHQQITDPEVRQKTKEDLGTAFNQIGESTASGVSEVVGTGSEYAKTGATSARNSIKYAGGKLYEGGAAAGSTVKGKLDESGITEKSK